MDMWKEFFVHLRVKCTSAKNRIIKLSGTFDFSQNISPVTLQYVIQQEPGNLQKYLEAKEYVVSMTENCIDINFVEKHKTKIDMDAAGDDVCSTLVDFLVSYTSKPVILPMKIEKDLDLHRCLQDLKCQIFWAAESHAYWIAGRHDDVMQGYKICQEKKRELWFHMASERIQTKEPSFSPSVDTKQFDDVCIKFKINTRNERRMTGYGGTFKVTEFIDMSVVQFMLKHDMGYCRFCTEAAGLSFKVKGNVVKFAVMSEMDCPDLDEIGVKLTNFLVNISLMYTQNQVSVPENAVESFSLKLKERVQGQSAFKADCFWSCDQSFVWVAGRKKEIPECYGIVKGIRDSFIFRPEYAQVAVDCKGSEDGAAKSSLQQNAANDKCSRTIEVHGLDSTVTQDTVLFYFENRRRSGGGTVEHISFKDNIYLVTFDESKAVQRVLQQQHKINGVTMTLKKHTPTTQSYTLYEGLEKDLKVSQQEDLKKMVNIETEDCCICMGTPTDPKTLPKCGHTFCTDCIDQYFKVKPACPNCGQVYGKLTGNQPDGKMYVSRSHTSLPGYESCASIRVTYRFPDGYQGPDDPSPGQRYKGVERTGHLPDNEKGRLVVKLLNVAFTRRLVFTIKRSRTGQDEVLTWNDIHHKTRIEGGPGPFGYPDRTYLDRVLEELANKGVTLESADDPQEYREYTNFLRY